MNLESFKDKLALYGADLSRWPEDLQAPARTLIEGSAEAQREFVKMQGVDRLFTGKEGTPLPEGLLERIIKKSEES